MKFNKNKFFYTVHDNLHLSPIRWFRLKMSAIIALSVIGAVCLVLAVNHFYYDFLGLGYNRIQSLTHENQVLQQQLSELNSRMHGLETSLNTLNQQGNQFRLMVDLPPLDAQTQSAGIGGTNEQSDFGLASDEASKILQSSYATLQKLAAESKIQNQSYEQVVQKYEYNKGYFAALPAIKPMEGYYSYSGFGLRMHPVLGMFRTHEGLDIINDVGTSVVATGDGVVEMAGPSGGGYGTVVLINHGYGYQTLYAHLSRVLVKEGEHIKRGDLVAKSGKTGLVTGPHLHYEVRHKGICQNPVDYFFNDLSLKEYRARLASR